MSVVDSAGRASALDKYAIEREQNLPSQELGKNEFMELMLAQMKSQNPLEPQDNGDFIAQLAQFSSLEEMQGLAKTVDNAVASFRSTQALQASALVGRSVLVKKDSAPLLADGTMKGVVDLPASTASLKLSISNETGELVRQIDLGQQRSGNVSFTWDGKNSQGQAMPAGTYSVRAEASTSKGSEEVTTLLGANVDSVSLGRAGAVTLNLAGIGAMALSDVRQIH